MGPHYVDFTFAFDTTLIRLEMTEIWPKYIEQVFLLPPPESSAQDPPWIGLNIKIHSLHSLIFQFVLKTNFFSVN